MLLRELAATELRLVATHPDGHGGLTFVGQYPNAYTTFIFALSCVIGAAVANQMLDVGLGATTYGYIMAGWLLIVLALFAIPLLAFRKPLTALKERTILVCSAQATRHFRAVERELLDANMSAAKDADPLTAKEISDPSKALAAAQKMSTLPFSRSALLPLSVAALLPLVAAGSTQLPLKEMVSVVKRLLLL